MAWPVAETAPDHALTRALTSCLPGGRVGGPLLAFRSVDSTQTLARAWADAGAPEGAVVVADHQSAGRGQHGRRWTAPPGTALLFSAVLRPRFPVARWPEIPLAAGCAVAETLEALGGGAVTLKWPNDVLVGETKLAGILAEGVAGAPPLVVLGVGVNVSQREADWPADLAGRARSLLELGVSVDRATLLGALLERVDRWYGVLADAGFAPVRAAWRRRGALGGRIRLADGEGTAEDLGPAGELLVRRDDGRRTSLVAPPGERPEPARAGAA
jgi:BirA family biotin operon repressor/biotin-[acetyl-CoA-carboxylase] ligase